MRFHPHLTSPFKGEGFGGKHSHVKGEGFGGSTLTSRSPDCDSGERLALRSLRLALCEERNFITTQPPARPVRGEGDIGVRVYN